MSSSRLAYLILAHTDPQQLKNLVEALDHHADFYIHIDGKSKIAPFQNRIPPANNVTYLADRKRVSWGGYSQVEATAALFAAALGAEVSYEYLVVLSGMDFPIKSNEGIVDYLGSQPYRQHIRLGQIDEDSNSGMASRIRRYHFRDQMISPALANKVLRKSIELGLYPFSKQVPKGLIPCFGSNWIALTPDCAQFVLTYLDDNPNVIRFFRHAYCPDELVFHSVIASTRYRDETPGLEAFSGTHPCVLANLHLVQWNLSTIHTEEHYDEIRESGKLFVRKLHSGKSAKLMKMLRADR
jgi:hypothetical protein